MAYSDWITEHFEQLVVEHGGRYIAVVGEEVVAVGNHPREVEAIALERYPGQIPSVMRVPTEDDIVCLL